MGVRYDVNGAVKTRSDPHVQRKLKKRLSQFRVPPRRVLRRGRIAVCLPRKKRIPVVCRGRGPRTPAIPGCCALFVRNFPRLRRGAGGFLPFVRCGRQGFGRYAPRCTPLRPGSLRAFAALPPPALRSGGWGWGLSLLPCGPLPADLPPLPAAGGGGSRGSLSAFVGVSRVAFPVFRGSFRPLPVRALARLCPGRVVSPVPPCVFRLCGGRPLLVARRRCVVLAVVGAALVAGGFVLCRAPRPGRSPALLAGVGAGGPAACSGGAWSRFAPLGCCGCRRCGPPGRVAVSLSLFPAAAAPALVGFSGSRRLAPPFRPLVAGVVASVVASGRSVAVGCAAGADAFVRAAAPGALVFSVASFGSGRGAFAARSVALVRAVAAGGPGSGLVVFPGASCPLGLSPSASASACFCGLGSGSWASAAFAAGLGLPVVVFPCGFSALPAWGAWSPLSGAWAGGFVLR